MSDWTPLGALIVSTILLPLTAALWWSKADKETVGEVARKKADEAIVNESLDALESDNDHLRDWLTTHEASDERMFREIRDGMQKLGNQIQGNFQTLILEIRRAGNGKGS